MVDGVTEPWKSKYRVLQIRLKRLNPLQMKPFKEQEEAAFEAESRCQRDQYHTDMIRSCKLPDGQSGWILSHFTD
jgi:hypothetical protein